MARLHLRLLGTFRARVGDDRRLKLPDGKTEAFLAYLALRPGQRRSADRVISLFWGSTDATAAAAFQQTLFVLQGLLTGVTPAPLVVGGGDISLDPDAIDVDAAVFESLVSEGSAYAGAGADDALERALELYEGDFLEALMLSDAAVDEWIVAERERLRWLAVQTMERVLAARAVTAPRRAIATARRLVALEPLHEDGHRTLMRLYAGQQRWGAALRQYQVCRSLLEHELGAEPHADTRALYDQLLRRRPPTPALPVSVAAATHAGRRRRPRRRVRSQADSTGDIPLVGRSAELVRLRTALGGLATGWGSLAAIFGGAGIGKTRLMNELAHDAIRLGARVLVGHCYEAEQRLPLRPWTDAFRAGQVIADLEEPDGLANAWREELRSLFPELALPTASVALGDDALTPRLFEAVGHAMEHLAARQPLVVLIEDAHWADELSLRLLAFLAERVADSPVLLAISARSSEHGDLALLRRVLQETNRTRRLVALHLGPLTRHETDILVSALGGGRGEPRDAERLSESVWLASAGNPLIAVETFRAIRDDGDWRDVPVSVPDVIVRRLARLSAPARSLLSAAAVHGRQFDLDVVGRAAGLDEDAAADAVDELITREIVHGVEHGFDFTHDRLRHVALGQLTDRAKADVHRHLAETLEDLHREQLASHLDALALHWEGAEGWEQAIGYFRRAGGRAFLYGAHREAVQSFDRALEALRRLPETRDTLALGVDLLIDLQIGLLPLGALERLGRAAEEACELAERSRDQGRLGRALAYLAAHCWWTGDHERGLDACRRAREIAAVVGVAPLHVTSLFQEGLIRHAIGDLRLAATMLHEAADAVGGGLTSERLGSTDFTVVYASAGLARVYADLGEVAEAGTWATRAVDVAERRRQPWLLAIAYVTAGIVAMYRDELDVAIVWFERLRDAAHGGDFPVFASIAAPLLACACARAGRAEARTLLAEATHRIQTDPAPPHYPFILSWLADGHRHTRNVDMADHLGALALGAARERGERGQAGWALAVLGETAAARGDAAEADACFHEALAIADMLGMRPLAGRCHEGLARLR